MTDTQLVVDVRRVEQPGRDPMFEVSTMERRIIGVFYSGEHASSVASQYVASRGGGTVQYGPGDFGTLDGAR